ncbi:hypothetical protein [Alkalilimnicola ehrlichii]|uniref:hypothetical protein n=1 Tax=Alkalilimnicola ehrlichii TaxID=351052 RepID=UPI001C6DFBAE|nr:hypothetical protein [Alkalilimnicola ehrlichii]
MRWLLPRSLRGRFVLIMVMGVLSAQLVSYAVWSSQVRDRHLEQVDELSRNVAYSIASTVRFFRSLPVEYRHIVLEQLRQMGGTRFFVSVNSERLTVEDLRDSPEKALIVNNVNQVLSDELGITEAVIEFSARRFAGVE